MGYAGDYKASTLRAWRSRDECRQASVVVAASFPRRLRHLSATVLQCLRHGLWGGGSGGSAAMSGPLALFQNTIPANRDVTRNALGGPVQPPS
jgi:ATP-dependent protease HslVU (ClpYQ) peptidase subunit